MQLVAVHGSAFVLISRRIETRTACKCFIELGFELLILGVAVKNFHRERVPLPTDVRDGLLLYLMSLAYQALQLPQKTKLN